MYYHSRNFLFYKNVGVKMAYVLILDIQLTTYRASNINSSIHPSIKIYILLYKKDIKICFTVKNILYWKIQLSFSIFRYLLFMFLTV